MVRVPGDGVGSDWGLGGRGWQWPDAQGLMVTELMGRY